MSKRALMLVGDFVEDYEAMVPYQMLQLVGCAVDVVSPGKKSGENVKTAIHDFCGDQTYSEKPGHLFAITADFDAIDIATVAAQYDALVIPGGRAPEFLRLEEKILNLVRAFASAKRPIAAICHGPQILTAAGVVRGVRGICYPAVRPEWELAGGIWGGVNENCTNAVVDQHFVTAPAWPAHPTWMRELFTMLGIAGFGK
ncbi:MAG: DJ-1/PfpI family protein [Thermoguttaceae bacterium]|nr:DJ-1/PfpI family protein [Thermoguttaceae bacterium]